MKIREQFYLSISMHNYFYNVLSSEMYIDIIGSTDPSRVMDMLILFQSTKIVTNTPEFKYFSHDDYIRIGKLIRTSCY